MFRLPIGEASRTHRPSIVFDLRRQPPSSTKPDTPLVCCIRRRAASRSKTEENPHVFRPFRSSTGAVGSGWPRVRPASTACPKPRGQMSGAARILPSLVDGAEVAIVAGDWRGAGVAERAALEMPCTHTGTAGSNPALSDGRGVALHASDSWGYSRGRRSVSHRAGLRSTTRPWHSLAGTFHVAARPNRLDARDRYFPAGLDGWTNRRLSLGP